MFKTIMVFLFLALFMVAGVSTSNAQYAQEFITPIYINGDVSTKIQELDIADSGNGSPATATLYANSNVIRITCADTDGCDVTMGEYKVTPRYISITSDNANLVNFADTSGVSELNGAYAMKINENISMIYTGTEWVEVSRNNGDPAPTKITPGTGTGLTVLDTGSSRGRIYVVTVDYSGLSAASTTASHTLATLPAGTRIVGLIADTTVAYVGGAVSAATIQVGIDSGDTDAFLVASDVFSGVITVGDANAELGTLIISANATSGGYINWAGTTVISALITATGANTSVLTAGSTTYYIQTVQVK